MVVLIGFAACSRDGQRAKQFLGFRHVLVPGNPGCPIRAGFVHCYLIASRVVKAARFAGHTFVKDKRSCMDDGTFGDNILQVVEQHNVMRALWVRVYVTTTMSIQVCRAVA